MGTTMAENSSETNRLLRRTLDEDQESWGALLTRHQEIVTSLPGGLKEL
jgi:hypothetical protein